MVGMGYKTRLGSYLTIPAEIHDAVTALSEEDRRDRDKVNDAVRQKLRNIS
jgi:hypothetical protein